MSNHTTTGRPSIFILDDDSVGAESISRLVLPMEVPTLVFHSAEDFLDFYEDQPGCLVTDHRLSGKTGLELQEELLARGKRLPVILVTAFARTALTVRAVKAGAITVLDKPFSEDEMWQGIRKALATDAARRAEVRELADISLRLAMLSDKERQVLDRVVVGKPNKKMAADLGVSLRTIENRRRSIFTKLRVKSVAELVALVLRHDESHVPSKGHLRKASQPRDTQPMR